jgi:hypothetical protein
MEVEEEQAGPPSSFLRQRMLQSVRALQTLFVAKDTGLPLRVEIFDAGGAGGIQMNYSELTTAVNIGIPACMAGK